MTDSRVSDLTQLAAGGLAIGDQLPVDDVSAGTLKRMRADDLGLASSIVLPPAMPIASAPASTATGSTNQWYAVRTQILRATTLTGCRYRLGTVASGNVRSALYLTDLSRVANTASAVAVGTANQIDAVPWDATYAAAAGEYIVLVWFSSATATFMGARHMVGTANGTQSGATPSPLSSLAVENSDRAIIIPY